MRKKKKQGYLDDPTLTEEEKLDRNIKRKPVLIKKLKHDAIIKVVTFLAAFIITFTFIFGVTRAETSDMYPAIHEGDVILYFRLGNFMNNDVVIYETKDGRNIGRVNGTEGTEVGKTDGDLLTINGNLQPVQPDSGIGYETKVKTNGALAYPSTVGADQYLVLGDDRKHARDSRDYGFIAKGHIKGKIFTIMRRRPL